MRAWQVIACIVGAHCACDDDRLVVELPPPNTTVRFHIPVADSRRTCFQLGIRNTDDVWYASPWYTSPADYLTSFEGALEAGSLCSDRPFDHVIACRPGEHEATLTFEGLFEDDTEPDDWYAFYRPVRFTCVREREVVVEFAPTVAERRQHRGYVELAVQLASEVALTQMCVSARVDNGAGETIRTNYGPTCANDSNVVSTYLDCDNTSQPNRLLLVLDRFELAPDEPISERNVINPCPAGDDTHLYWGKACVQEFECPARGSVDMGLFFTLGVRD